MQFAGLIVDRILEEGFEISAMQSQFLERIHAEEFLDLYRVVLPDFAESID
jgi:nucleoside-diphosphate kinase